MEHVCLSYKIRKMHKLDDNRVYKFLYKELDDKNLMKSIKEHIRKGVCYKVQNESNEIKGVFLAIEFEEHISLSYYLLDFELRRKPISLEFFLTCLSKLNLQKPIIVKKNKNFETYKNYFFDTKEDDGQILFIGFRGQEIQRLIEKWVG